MKMTRWAILGSAALLLLASGAAAQDTASAPAKAGMPGMHMNHGEAMATLVATSGAPQPAGMAMLRGTTIQLTFSGDQPGSTRPWHVHKGTCTDDEGIVGRVGSYPALSIGQDGRGTAKATLSQPLPATGSYFVAVYASASDMKTVIACGPLNQGGM